MHPKKTARRFQPFESALYIQSQVKLLASRLRSGPHTDPSVSFPAAPRWVASKVYWGTAIFSGIAPEQRAPGFAPHPLPPRDTNGHIPVFPIH
jgi:hypothetical protein